MEWMPEKEDADEDTPSSFPIPHASSSSSFSRLMDVTLQLLLYIPLECLLRSDEKIVT